jgi:hypothetical protein
VPTLATDPELVALLAIPRSFVPLKHAKDRLCKAVLPREPAAWLARLEQCAQDEQPLPEEIEAAYYEAAYGIWQAIWTDSLRTHYLDPATQHYLPMDHSHFRLAAVEIASEARAEGADAVADWHEGQRPFDLNFYRQLRDDERNTGRHIEGPVNYLARLYVVAEELFRWLVPQLALAAEKRGVVDAVPQPDVVTDSAPHSAQPKKVRQSNNYLYNEVRRLLGVDPNLTCDEIISRLKQRGIQCRNGALYWECPAGGGTQMVKLEAFRRHVANLKKEAGRERK